MPAWSTVIDSGEMLSQWFHYLRVWKPKSEMYMYTTNKNSLILTNMKKVLHLTVAMLRHNFAQKNVFSHTLNYNGGHLNLTTMTEVSLFLCWWIMSTDLSLLLLYV